MTKYILAILSTLILWAGEAFTQRASREIDSLEALSATAPDSLLPQIYYNMAWQNRLNNPVRGIQYALKAIDASLTQDNRYYIIMGYTVLALCEKYGKMQETALQHYITAKDYAEQFDMEKLKGHCYNNLARQYLEQNDLAKGDEYVRKAITIAKNLGDSIILAYSYLDLGILYQKQNKLDLAIGYLTESYQMNAGQENAFSLEIFVTFWHLADIYMEREEYSKSKDLMYMNINNPKIQNMPDFMSRTWYKLSQIYFKTNMLDSAEYAGLKSKEEATKSLNMNRIGNSCRILDSIYQAQGQLQKAAAICKSYMNICDSVFNKELSEQLVRIQYSSEYMENKKSMEQSLNVRNIFVMWLIISLVVLVVGGYFIYVLLLRNRKIRHLNKDLMGKRKQLERGLSYAHAIQMAVQSDIQDSQSIFDSQFLLYIPRHIVSGDFFWRYHDEKYEMIAVADCTGHGVPGAMLTMLGTSMLQDMATAGMRKSGEILNELRARIKFMMGVNDKNRMQDGMDISLIIIDRMQLTLDYAGAYNPLWYIRDGKINEIKATRCPIGEYVIEMDFESKKMELKKGDLLLMMTDGYTSQFGGEENTKITQQQLRNLLLENRDKPMQEIHEILQKYFNNWKGTKPQVDDVTIAGFRLK